MGAAFPPRLGRRGIHAEILMNTDKQRTEQWLKKAVSLDEFCPMQNFAVFLLNTSAEIKNTRLHAYLSGMLCMRLLKSIAEGSGSAELSIDVLNPLLNHFRYLRDRKTLDEDLATFGNTAIPRPAKATKNEHAAKGLYNGSKGAPPSPARWF